MWIVVLALTGCGTWTKPGVTDAQASADQKECGLRAAEAHPPQMLNAPEIPLATDTQCASIYGQAQCAPLGRRDRAAQTDMNDGARHVAFEQCLQAKGYRYTAK
ncbi:hypothetical protein ASF43_09515 [Pseudorhodoferax sp. Leaf267]|nr:hypothetical protein ASF43_09515 [Pseudorhodoferax sp. Leaf267]